VHKLCVALLLLRRFPVGSEIRLLDGSAVSVDDAREPGISFGSGDRFPIGPEIGFLDQVAVVVIAAGEFGITVLPNHGFAIGAEKNDFDIFSVAVEGLGGTGIAGAAAYDWFIIDAKERVFDQMIIDVIVSYPPEIAFFSNMGLSSGPKAANSNRLPLSSGTTAAR
jgi:hypothetical protein